MSFTASDVMALRQKTGMGMMDCKRALTEADGDAVKAEGIMRARLKGKMDERTERVTAEGAIGIAVEGSAAAIIEIQTETDFTARNVDFRKVVEDVARLALSQPVGSIQPDDAISRRIEDIKLTTKENINFARGEKLEGGHFGTYVHHDGKRAALVQIDGSADDATLTGVCQHIVAHVPTPVGVDESDLPAAEVDAVRAAAIEEAQGMGKNQEIAAKIADGKVRKYLQEKTLLNQMYVRDTTGKTPVRKALGDQVTVKRFVRYTVGT